MIYWTLQRSANHPELVRGECPPGLLSAVERDQFSRLTIEKRRRDWLLGRWTAKLLLRGLPGAAQPGHPLETLSITTSARGAPVGLAPGRPPWALSISHSRGTAVCAAAGQPQALIGVDLEYVEPRSDSLVQDFYTDAEQTYLSRLDRAQHSLGVTAVWSAKEAALKALQTGLTVDTRTVSCEPRLAAPSPDGWRPLAVAIDEARLGRPAPQLAGWWRVLEAWVLAVVTSSEAVDQAPLACGDR